MVMMIGVAFPNLGRSKPNRKKSVLWLKSFQGVFLVKSALVNSLVYVHKKHSLVYGCLWWLLVF